MNASLAARSGSSCGLYLKDGTFPGQLPPGCSNYEELPGATHSFYSVPCTNTTLTSPLHASVCHCLLLATGLHSVELMHLLEVELSGSTCLFLVVALLKVWWTVVPQPVSTRYCISLSLSSHLLLVCSALLLLCTSSLGFKQFSLTVCTDADSCMSAQSSSSLTSCQHVCPSSEARQDSLCLLCRIVLWR